MFINRNLKQTFHKSANLPYVYIWKRKRLRSFFGFSENLAGLSALFWTSRIRLLSQCTSKIMNVLITIMVVGNISDYGSLTSIVITRLIEQKCYVPSHDFSLLMTRQNKILHLPTKKFETFQSICKKSKEHFKHDCTFKSVNHSMQCTSGTAKLWGWVGYSYSPTNNFAFPAIS